MGVFKIESISKLILFIRYKNFLHFSFRVLSYVYYFVLGLMKTFRSEILWLFQNIILKDFLNPTRERPPSIHIISFRFTAVLSFFRTLYKKCIIHMFQLKAIALVQ